MNLRGYRVVAATTEMEDGLLLEESHGLEKGAEVQTQKSPKSQCLNITQSYSMLLCYHRFEEKVCGLKV